MRRRGGRRYSPAESGDTEADFWMSYGDLFAGLLLIFALMLLAALFSYQSGMEGVREILLVRQQIVEELQQEFQVEEGRIAEVTESGAVRFGDKVLFEQGSAVIRPEGMVQIEAFARQYMSVILDNPRFRSQIRRIIIEGHTNDDGEYFFNLRLSQDRAYAVMTAILNAAEDRHRTLLVDRMTAVGRSFADLRFLDSEETEVDKEGSRRIEIRFDLDDESVMLDLLDLFPAGGNS